MYAICPNISRIHYAAFVYRAKQEQFDGFIQALFDRDFSQLMVSHQDTNKWCDNAPCHRGVEERLSDSVPEDLAIVRLPPYTAAHALYALEYYFQSVKAHIKRSLNPNSPSVSEECHTNAAAKRQPLVSLIPESLTKSRNVDSQSQGSFPVCYFYHGLTFSAPAALRLEELWHSKYRCSYRTELVSSTILHM